MKRISEKEKLRILKLHESTPMKPWLIMENPPTNSPLYNQIKADTDKSYPQIIGGTYGGNPNQAGKTLSQKEIDDIQKFAISSELNNLGPVPFKTQQEGNNFRIWVNKNYKSIANFLKLDEPGPNNPNPSFNNDYIKRAWFYNIGGGEFGVDFTKTLGTVYCELTNILGKELDEAKRWWLMWLGNVTTTSKFKKLNNLSWLEVTEKYLNYFKIINDIKLNYTVNTTDSANSYGFVMCSNLKQININLNKVFEKQSNQIVETMIHEMQHLLYCYFPLTPAKDVTQFKSSDDCYYKNKKIYDNTEITWVETVDALINNKKNEVSNDLGIPAEDLYEKLREIIRSAYKGWGKDYLLRSLDDDQNSEFQSRLAGTRKYFGLTGGGDITKQQIVNYIKNPTDNGQVDFILAHWVLKEFPPLGEFVNDLNTKFVSVDPTKQKQSPLDLPYKPKDEIA